MTPLSIPRGVRFSSSTWIDEMRTAAAYIRVSTDDQTEFSPDAQLKRIKEYAASHDILLLPDHIYTELGVSGRSAARRPRFMALMTAAKRKPRPFDVVLIHAFDRFARSVKDSRIYKELLRDDLGIELISITEDFGGGKNSFLMESIKDVMNEYYSLNLRDEVLKGMTEKATRGQLQSTAPYGYTTDKGQLVPVEGEAENVRAIFRRFVDGDGMLTIARWLNSIGARTHRGGAFEARTVQYILSNPAYIGYLRWTPGRRKRDEMQNDRTIIAKSAHQPLVSQELFDAAREKLNLIRLRNPRHARPPEEQGDWLSGLVKCSVCGGSLVFSKAAGYNYMNCYKYSKGLCDTSNRVKTERMHSLVLDALRNFIASPDPGYILHLSKAQDVLGDLKKQKASLESRLARYKDAYLAGVDSLEDYAAYKKIIDGELSRISESISALTAADSQSADSTSADGTPEDSTSAEKALPVPRDEIRRKLTRVIEIITDPKASLRDKINAARSVIHHATWDRATRSLSVYYIF